LSTTALVDEAFLRFKETTPLDLNDRAHFKAVVARVMRRVLTDAARQVGARKRGSDAAHIPFDEEVHLQDTPHTMEDVLNLDLAIERLSKIDERQAHVVVYRFYADMEYKEIACVLGVSVPTIRRDWEAARALLTRWLNAA
jgi:RNA polymerase sigma factor (TIGR02999 family)